MILQVDIETCLSQLLTQEDTDRDKKITIEDKGPKSFNLVANSGESYTVNGTYYLSNLLQELVIAKTNGLNIASIDTDVIEERPVERVSKIIKNYFWNGLTRTMDEKGIESLIHDTKNESLASEKLLFIFPNTCIY